MSQYKVVAVAGLLGVALLTGCRPDPSLSTAFNPKAAEINRQLVMEYLHQGNSAKAREKLNLALVENPRSPMVLDTAAYFYSKTGNDTLAGTYFQRAINLAPSDGRYHNNYGVYLYQKKNYQGALNQFLMAVTDFQYTQVDHAYENAGACAQQMGNLPAAMDYYRHALKINPKRANALLQLAQISYDSQQFSQAKAYLMRYHGLAGFTKASRPLDTALGITKSTTSTHHKRYLHERKQR